MATKKLVVLYGIGGLSDVGRHAILAALEQSTVSKITVITEYPELLDETNWECNCTEPHTNPAKTSDKVDVVAVDSWKNKQANLSQHFEGVDAVISCLGHRQPGWKYPQLKKRGIIAAAGNRQVIEAMKEAKVDRAVVMSSPGIQEDWPPLEYHFLGNFFKLLFTVFARKPCKDLNEMEVAYKDSPLDYLFVRPTGLGEEVVPCGKYYLQTEKHSGSGPGFELAKMDCARYMVEEAINPTSHKTGVVVGSEPEAEKKDS